MCLAKQILATTLPPLSSSNVQQLLLLPQFGYKVEAELKRAFACAPSYMPTVGTKCRCTRNQQSELSAAVAALCCTGKWHRGTRPLRTLSNFMSARSSDRVHSTLMQQHTAVSAVVL